MNFGCCYGPQDIKNPICAICQKTVQMGEKIVVDRKSIHKVCFNCGVCGVQLTPGECALDEHLSRYGPVWFCHNHHLIPPKQKEQLLQKRGFKWRSG